MTCHKCGNAVPPGAQFCPGCGARSLAFGRTNTDDLRMNFSRLSWSFAASLLSFAAIIVFAHEKQLEVSPGLGAFTVLVLFVSGVCFYVFLGILAVRMGRSPVVWVGATLVFTPFGPFAAYYGMWRLVGEAVKASKSHENASLK